MSVLRLAVVGVGWAGTRQVEAVREVGRKIAVTCLVDGDAGFLRQKAEALGVAKTFVRLEEALADPDVDAVSICTPHHLHCAMAIAAAEARKHVLVEKPMAMTVDEATRMIVAAEANGVTLYVGETRTYAPASQFLRDVVESGRYVGEVTCATVMEGFRAPEFGYAGRRAWLTRPDLGGTGTWMLHGIHTMAQLRYVLGEVRTVYLREHHAASFQRPDIEGTMSGLLTLERGASVAVVQTCETRLSGTLGGMTIHGDRGSLRATSAGYEVFEGDGPRDQSPRLQPYPEAALTPHALQMEAFADHVAGITAGPTTGRSERRTLAIVQAGYESARSGQPVELRQRFGDLR
ncbi:MAG: Gfo/Idh/MocA family oxidoreductase [Chloroflexi bacterium]|nr:Gfo/Idh/MocA family oxidoreductase [Chloroflexota bacterium]